VIRLQLFGAVDLRVADGPKAHTVLAQAKHVALVALLASARRSVVRRDRIIGLLWPDLNEDRARNALSKAIHNCRRTLGEDALTGGFAEDIGLDADRWTCDVWAFQDALDRGAQSEAMALYSGGPFLDGFFVPDSSALEQWIDVERTRLRDRALGAATALATAAERAGDLTVAAERLAIVSALSPMDERVVRHRIDLLNRGGNRAGAIAAFAEFSTRLRQELDASPAPETVALIDAIRHRLVIPDESAVGAVAIAAATDGVAEATAPQDPTGDETTAYVRLLDAEATSSGLNASRRPRALHGPRRLLAVGAGALLIATAWALRGLASNGTDHDVPDRVVVTPFDNQTGDSTLTPLGEMVADRLGAALTRAGLTEVVESRSRVRQGLTVANRDGSTDTERLAAKARETGAGIVITGRYYLSANLLHVHADIRGLRGRAGALTFAEESGPRDDPREVLRRVEQRVVGVFASIRDIRVPAASTAASSPPTLAAYTSYVDGLTPWIAGDMRTAARYFLRALEQDSTFVAVVPWLVDALSASGGSARADSIMASLGQRREQLDAYDRAFIDWTVAFRDGDREAMYAAATRMVQLAPRSPDAQWSLGFAAVTTNRFGEAITAFRRADLDHGWTNEKLFTAVNWQTTAYHLLSRHDEELALVRAQRDKHPYESDVCRYELRAMAVKAPLSELTRAMDGCLSTSGGVDSAWIAGTRLLVTRELRAHDRAADGVQFALPAVTWYREQLRGEVGSRDRREDLGNALLEVGAWAEALPLFESIARELPDNRPPRFAANAAIAAVHVGDTTSATQMLARLSDGPKINAFSLQRARALAHLGRKAEAVAELRHAVAGGISAAEQFHATLGFEPLQGFPAFDVLVRPRD